MAYTSGGDILSTHYNGFTSDLDLIWGTGSTDTGYGQGGLLGTVAPGQDVTATQWASLLNRMSTIALHQGTSIASVTNPVTGDDIAAIDTISANIATLLSNRLINSANAADAANSISASGSWTVTSTQQGRLTFSSANAARFFFNAGGEIRSSFSRSGGSIHSKNAEWSDLANKCGTLVLGARTFAKIGGSGAVNILNNFGFFDLSTSLNTNFKQFADTSPYTSNYINVQLSTASSGAQLNIKVDYVDAAADTYLAAVDVVDGTLLSTIVERPPSTANLSNSWGNPSFTILTNTQS